MPLLKCSGCSTRYAPSLERCPHCGQAGGVEEGSRKGSRLPFLDAACPTAGCRAEGVVRRVQLRTAALGVVEMPHLLMCACCGAAMPALRSWLDEEDTMAKISRLGGPTNAAADREREAAVRPPSSETGKDAPAVHDSTGKEEPSPGNSSSTSAEKPPTSSGKTKPAPRKRARTTASPSSQDPTASSTAAGTATSGPETPADEGGGG